MHHVTHGEGKHRDWTHYYKFKFAKSVLFYVLRDDFFVNKIMKTKEYLILLQCKDHTPFLFKRTMTHRIWPTHKESYHHHHHRYNFSWSLTFGVYVSQHHCTQAPQPAIGHHTPASRPAAPCTSHIMYTPWHLYEELHKKNIKSSIRDITNMIQPSSLGLIITIWLDVTSSNLVKLDLKEIGRNQFPNREVDD